MAAAETARLIASLELKDQFTPGVNKALGGLGRLDAGITRSGGRAYKAGQQIGTGIKTGAVIAAGAIGFLATQVGFGLRSLIALDKATSQTNAVIKSTKGVAGQTSDSIRDLAEKYENLNAIIDDKVIQSGENVLLTFTNIRKQAFEPTLKAALDMNQALGGGEAGLQGTITRIGKALNDPIKGLTALGRVGVTFTKTQKDQIQAAVKAGDTFKAQGIILAELEKRFGGSFKTAGESAEGTMAGIGDAVEDLQKTLATGLLPVIRKVLPQIRSALTSPEAVKGAKQIGDAIASMFSDKNLKAGADFLKGAFQTAKDAAPIVSGAAKTTLGFVQAAVGLFKSLPPEIQKLAIGAFAINKVTGGLVTNIAGGIIETVGKQFLQRGGTPVNPLFVFDVAGGAGAIGGAAAVAGGGAAAGAAALALPVTVIAASIVAPIVAQQKISSDQQIIAYNLVTTRVQDQITKGASLAQLQQSLAAVNQGINDIQGNPLNMIVGGEALKELKTQSGDLQRAIDAVKIAGRDTVGGIEHLATAQASELGARRAEAAENRATLAGLPSEFARAIKGVREAKQPENVLASIKAAIALAIGKDKGSLDSTKSLVSALKSQLKNIHDPKLSAALRTAIKQVEGKLPGREFAAKSLARADAMLRDGKITNREMKDLQAIERQLKDRGLPHAASVISARVDAAKKAQVAAEHATAQAVRNKKTSISLNIPVNVRTNVSLRDFTKTYVTGRAFGALLVPS